MTPYRCVQGHTGEIDIPISAPFENVTILLKSCDCPKCEDDFYACQGSPFYTKGAVDLTPPVDDDQTFEDWQFEMSDRD
jgi:hypothetical protein